MARSCIVRPPKAKGQSPELFDAIKGKIKSVLDNSIQSKQIIYDTTWKLYGLAISTNFQKRFKDTLSFNAEGIPTLDSLLENKYAKKILGSDLHNRIYENNFQIRENTRDNYLLALESAMTFNKNHPDKIALVEYNDKQIFVKVVNRSSKTLKQFKEQYATVVIIKKATELLKPLGIEIGDIIGKEAEYRNGKVDFTKAKELLEGINSLIMAANSAEGAKAIGEELSHLIVGTKRTSPLVQRLLTNLQQNKEAIMEILGDQYYAEMEAYGGDMAKVAEEALGQLLHRHLIDNSIEQAFPEKHSGLKNLFSRLRIFILNKFKGKDINATAKILNEAENALSDIAKDITEGTIKLTKKDIRNSYSNTVLNSLVEQNKKNIKILEEALKVERKRYVITDNVDKKSKIEEIIKDIEDGINPSTDTLLALAKYLHYGLSELVSRNYSTKDFNDLSSKEKFQTLLNIRSYIQSFEPIVKMLYKTFSEHEDDDEFNSFDNKFEFEGTTITIFKTLKEFSSALNILRGQYEKRVLPSFVAFLEPIIGHIKDEDGNAIDITKMVTSQDGDISLLDRWLDSMANSSDQFLQTMDTIYRTAKDEARQKSIGDIRRIQALQQEADELGITDFEWMFEKYRDGHKTGNYIQPVNASQFYKDLTDFNNHLDKKYGKSPKGEDLENKKREKAEWLDKHAVLGFLGDYMPNPTLYENKQWTGLSKAKLDFFNKYMELKDYFDKNYPSDKVRNGAIQLRKDTVQRYIDMAKSPSSIITSIRESWNSAITNREDDDLLYGDRSTKKLMGFDGRQFNILPILYQNRLKDPDELSTDIFKAMTAYAISSNDYAAVNEVVDALEVGRTIITDGLRETHETINGSNVEEKVKVFGKEHTSKLRKYNTNMEDKLNEWFDSHIYLRHYAEETEFDIPIVHKRVSTVKMTSLLTKMASTCQLAFNFLSQSANVATGIAMTNIEAFSGEFFRGRDLLFADNEYRKMLPSFAKELNSRYQTNKMSLFGELFNVKYQFDERGRKSQVPSALTRLFGKEIGHLGQDGGDHWLYTRIAIAMCKHDKVKVRNADGSYTETSVWEATEIIDSPYGKGLKIMRIKPGTLNMDGTLFDVGAYSRKIGEVCHKQFGIYNHEDRVAAQRHSLGRMLILYRQWMKPQFNHRFQAKQYNQTLQAYEEGYYRTLIRLGNNMIRGKINLITEWDTLKDFEKRNIKRVMFEVGQFVALLILSSLISGGDKTKKRPWLAKYAEYMAKREEHELGNLVFAPTMLRELLTTVKSPSAVLGVVESGNSWIRSLYSPSDWNNEIESGPYKGHSTLYKKTTKLPVSALQWYHQIDKFTGGLEDRINYYARMQD